MNSGHVSGTTEVCLKHFNATHTMLDRSQLQARNSLSEMLGVTAVTGYRWFGHGELPLGDNLIKLQYMLEFVGYHVEEREALSELQRGLADLIALSLVSVKEIADYTRVTDNTVLRWATARTSPAGDSQEKSIRELVEVHGADVEKKRQAWREILQGLKLMTVEPVEKPVREPQQQPPNPAPIHGQGTRRQEIEILAHLILAAKPLASRVLTDEFSPEERNHLRELTAVGRSNGVFDLSNLLNRLCGERARKELA